MRRGPSESTSNDDGVRGTSDALLTVGGRGLSSPRQHSSHRRQETDTC